MPMPGNTAAMIMNAGAMSPPPTESDCKKLDDNNKERRDELDSKTEDKTLVGAEGDGEGTTVSSAAANGGVVAAHSRQKAQEKCDQTLVAGGNMEDRRQGNSSLNCPPAEPYKHPSPACQKSGHTEARILDYLGALPPGSSITFSIDWRPRNGAPSKMPCEACHKMLCYASDNCKMQVHLCDGDNQPKKLTDRHCPANAQNYQNLREDMGEG
jgi:hypothetical protein